MPLQGPALLIAVVAAIVIYSGSGIVHGVKKLTHKVECFAHKSKPGCEVKK